MKRAGFPEYLALISVIAIGIQNPLVGFGYLTKVFRVCPSCRVRQYKRQRKKADSPHWVRVLRSGDLDGVVQKYLPQVCLFIFGGVGSCTRQTESSASLLACRTDADPNESLLETQLAVGLQSTHRESETKPLLTAVLGFVGCPGSQ